MQILISGFFIFFIVFVLFLLILLAKATYLVKQAEVIIIERLGRYHSTLQSGLHFILPFVDQPRKVFWTFVKEGGGGRTYRYSENIERIDLRESVYDFPKQNVITKDNATIEINALLYSQITDPKSAVYEVVNLPQAIEKLTQTTLRNIIGSLDLDETLVSRDQVNEKLRIILDEATDKWGVKVNRVELQEVNPPVDIRTSMEKQMKAERDRRAWILEAEGKKRSAVLEAEGYKEAKIARAQGEAEARLTLATAESDAIKIVQQAIPGADPLPYMIAINYINALPKITEGKNDKLILLPYESSSLLGSLSTIKEVFKNIK
jgi:regulator of protease activity HflC (stomatin/prohibitin superfamily)